ncbi:MAG: cytochrome C oxidase subunit IV family protein [Opitutaceae bacterium]
MKERPLLPIRDLILTWIGLLALLSATVATILYPPGPWKTAVRMSLAVIEAGLVVSFFMKLRMRRGLIRVFASAGLFWLAILAVLMFADYAARR